MIGLIFGETDFPKQILKKIKNKKKYLIIDLTKQKIFKKYKNSHSVSIGQFGKIIKILKINKCNKILFAGKVKKPNFSKLKLDLKGVYYIPSIIRSLKLGDAAVFKKIIDIFKKEKIKTISSTIFTPELSLNKGNYSKIKPDNIDKNDITKAIKVLSKLNEYNFTQGVVVRENKFKKSGVLVKFPKKKQDVRVDLPTFGFNTLKQSKLAGLKGVVMKNKRNIFLDKKKCIQFANENKMFITIK
jgi:DUF1009 family protein